MALRSAGVRLGTLGQPSTLRDLPRPVADSTEDALPLARLLLVARPVALSCSDTTTPDDISPLLLPRVLIDGPARGWTVGPASGDLLVQSRLGNVVGELLQHEPEPVRQSASQLAWSCVLREQSGNPLDAIARLRSAAPRLAAIVEADLPAEVFAAASTLAIVQQAVVSEQLLGLPPRLLRAMLLALATYARNEGKPITGAASAVSALGSEDLDLLVEFVADKYEVGLEAGTRVWSIDPGRALHEARAAIERGAVYESYAWFESAPRECYGKLLDLLQDAGASTAAWRARWLTKVLPLAGADAQRVFAMMGLNTSSS